MESSAAETIYTLGKKLNDWFFTGNLSPIVILIAVYLLLVYKIIPGYMRNRSAYSLKGYLILYNIGQVLTCLYVVQKIDSTNVNVLNMWECFVYNENSPHKDTFVYVSYFIFWLKVVELSETIVFGLRKKQNQISVLHVYHHCVTVVLAFLLAKYVRGGPQMFSIYVNSWVHIIMYMYYLIALLGEKIQKKILRFKQSITILQMIQFCILLGQGVVFFIRGCNVPPLITAYYVFVIATIFYLFYDFYKKSYKKREIKNFELKLNSIVSK